MFRKLFFDYLFSVLYKILFTTMMKVQELDLSDSKCLCLSPHADDESIGMGATLIKYATNFDVKCLTNGCYGVKNGVLNNNQKAQVRKNEFQQAMQQIKVNSFEFFDEVEDKNLIFNNKSFCKIDVSQYDYIFIPNLLDCHRDHKAVAVLLNELLNTKLHKKDLKIVFYEVWSTLPDVNAYVDISDNVQNKKDLILLYKSQLNEYDYIDKMLNLNSYRGLPRKRDYVEAFLSVDKKLFKKLCKLYII